MAYEETPVKNGRGKAIVRKLSDYDLKDIPTSYVLWHLIVRHKFELVVGYAILITILYLFPFVI